MEFEIEEKATEPSLDEKKEEGIFLFSWGNYFSGHFDCRIFQSDNGYEVIGKQTVIYTMPDKIEFLIPDKALLSLQEKVAAVQWKWKKNYRKDGILDGSVWQLRSGSMESSGYAAFPEDFMAVTLTIHNELENFRLQYGKQAETDNLGTFNFKFIVLDSILKGIFKSF